MQKGQYILPYLPPECMEFVPNALTIARIILTPLILVLLWSDSLVGQSWAFALFVAAAISDYLDGKLARHYAVGSRLGQYLDPLADKVLVLGTFTVLAINDPYDTVPWWSVVLIALRDVVVTGMRTRAEARGRSLRTLTIAKRKTLVQLLFLIFFLLLRVVASLPGSWGQSGRWILSSPIPYVALIGVVVFTLVTGAIYVLQREHITPIETNG